MLPDHIAAAVRHHWWLFLLRGVAGVAFGVLTLLWPGATLVVLMAFIAAYALVDGIVALVYAFRLRPLFDRWWMLLIQGVISAAFGVLAIFNPGLSVAYIVVSVALWMLVAGLVQLLLARVQKTMGGSGRAGAGAPRARLDERLGSPSDASQTFALSPPPGYTAGRRWPVLFVLDPRGRALLGLKRFQDGAARLGWVILSSYNTLSDGPSEPNVAAVNAMLAWAQAHPSLDPTRLYLAGFSGPARAALGFTVALRGHVAGVIAVGGALGFALGGPETAFAGDATFAFFGSAGTRDFNYEEVLVMGDRFRTTRVPFRVVAFDGPHSWPPPDLCGDALEWLELRAMLGGLRAMDSGWVRMRLGGEVARAAELERLGRWAEAARLDEAIVRDYARWPQADDAAARAAALRRNEIGRAHV